MTWSSSSPLPVNPKSSDTQSAELPANAEQTEPADLAPEGDEAQAAPEVAPEVEESIYFAGLGGPRRSRQVVLAFKASDLQEVHWQLTRTHVVDYPHKP